jgi:hypothetical protein
VSIFRLAEAQPVSCRGEGCALAILTEVGRGKKSSGLPCGN